MLVDDEHITQGMRVLASEAKLIAEPAASIGLGALLAGSVSLKPAEKVCVLLTGGSLLGSGRPRRNLCREVTATDAMRSARGEVCDKTTSHFPILR